MYKIVEINRTKMQELHSFDSSAVISLKTSHQYSNALQYFELDVA